MARHSLRLNSGPVVRACDEAPAGLLHGDAGLAELRRRAARRRDAATLLERFMAAFSWTREDQGPSPHVEGQIYAGFIESGDQALMEQCHDLERCLSLSVGELEDRGLGMLGQRLAISKALPRLGVSSPPRLRECGWTPDHRRRGLRGVADTAQRIERADDLRHAAKP